jgi:hypothetical protein
MRCRDVELVVADAREHQVPDDVSVVYFGNPFSGAIFAAVVERLVRSVERKPRRLRVVYFNPVEHRTLIDAGFDVTKTVRGLRPGAEWSRSNSVRMYELRRRS